MLGFGEHEGDRELVQIGLRDGQVDLVGQPRADSILVRASAFNLIDQRSNCVEVQATLSGGGEVSSGELRLCRP